MSSLLIAKFRDKPVHLEHSAGEALLWTEEDLVPRMIKTFKAQA